METIQALFQIKENQYELRGKCMFQIETAGTNIKKRSTLYRAKKSGMAVKTQ